MKETIVIEKQDLKVVLNLLKKLMDIRPQWNKQLIDFYAKLYETYYSGIAFEQEPSFELNEMIWDLGLSLPSWDDDVQDDTGDER